ncbi:MULTISPECIES: hypothetical protein [unclassified Caballeronia]|uniref:hypothetical protein n=1 Tax=unclassified Caballeronia TaxID=2646786 RepID=UPI00158EF991|nr:MULTISPECIES: hypothetical protein [unclassified Caballeronia]QSN63563.1 hypothetical protein JYK05_15205 [Caballeronia sp. M1242]
MDSQDATQTVAIRQPILPVRREIRLEGSKSVQMIVESTMFDIRLDDSLVPPQRIERFDFSRPSNVILNGRH